MANGLVGGISSRVCLLVLITAIDQRPTTGQVSDRAVPLSVGDQCPLLRGRTLSGSVVVLPQNDRATVVVFSFSNDGGKDARLWNEQLHQNAASMGQQFAYVVLVMERVPRAIRSMVVFGMRKGVPLDVRDKMIVLENGEDFWKSRLGVTSIKRSYVIVVDTHGRLRWKSDGEYSTERFARLKEELRVVKDLSRRRE